MERRIDEAESYRRALAEVTAERSRLVDNLAAARRRNDKLAEELADQKALMDALAADLVHALEELRDIARDKERDLRAQNLAPEALDAALKELRKRLEEAENEAKQAHEKAVQRALKVEFAEDDDPDGVRQYLAQALGAIVRQLKDARFDAAKVTLDQAAEAQNALDVVLEGEAGSYEATTKLYPEFKALDLTETEDASVYEAMKQPAEEAVDKAQEEGNPVWTQKQSNSLWNYTNKKYRELNTAKRKEFFGELNENDDEAKEYIREANDISAALEKMTLSRDCMLTRGVKDLRFLRSHVAVEDIESLNKSLRERDFESVAYKITQSIADGAFSGVFCEPCLMSTSAALQGAFEDAPVVLRILAHEGTPGVCILGNVSSHPDEHEALIAPSSQLTIQKVYVTKYKNAFGILEDKLVIIVELSEDRIGGKKMLKPLSAEQLGRIK